MNGNVKFMLNLEQFIRPGGFADLYLIMIRFVVE